MISISKRLRSTVIILFIIWVFNISATPPDQEIGVLKDVSPKEVKIVGDQYFADNNPEPRLCEKPSSEELAGIPVTYLIRLIGDLDGGKAKNTAYFVKLQDKMPMEAELVSIEQVDSLDSNLVEPIMAYDGTNVDAYYRISGDFLEIYLDSIPAVEFPKDIKIKVIFPKCVAPATLYNSIMLSSYNDIEGDNNYASTNNYIGIAYDRRFGLECFEELFDKPGCQDDKENCHYKNDDCYMNDDDYCMKDDDCYMKDDGCNTKDDSSCPC